LSKHVLKQKFKPKNVLFLLKNRKNSRALGASPTNSLASGGAGSFAPSFWGLCPQTPATAPHDKFLATRLIHYMLVRPFFQQLGSQIRFFAGFELGCPFERKKWGLYWAAT